MFPQTLGISYRDHIANEEVKARTGNAIWFYEDLLTPVKRRKLKWYGHVQWSSGLAKTILQETVQGGRQRDRHGKWWEDNIKEWTGLESNTILRKAENCEEWRNLVVVSTVVPQRSARLLDRWEALALTQTITLTITIIWQNSCLFLVLVHLASTAVMDINLVVKQIYTKVRDLSPLCNVIYNSYRLWFSWQLFS